MKRGPFGLTRCHVTLNPILSPMFLSWWALVGCGSSYFTSSAPQYIDRSIQAAENIETTDKPPASPRHPGPPLPTPPPAPPAPSAPTPPPPKIQFGLLVNDLNCTFCHLEVHGNIGSVGDVPPLRSDSAGRVYGNWLVAGTFKAKEKLDPAITAYLDVKGKIQEKYNNNSKELPVDGSGKQALPTLNFDTLPTKMRGSLKVTDARSTIRNINKVFIGNVVLVGTATNPILLDRDILVQGDVVIAGVYQGVGTIYATGNIYIPANLTALRPASFPYPDNEAEGDKKAIADLAFGDKDALGLATAKNIFISDIENYMTKNKHRNFLTPEQFGLNKWQKQETIYDMVGEENNELLFHRNNNGVHKVYDWLPEEKFSQLYGSVTPCARNEKMSIDWELFNGFKWGERAFNRIDAYLYAARSIGGIARATNWTLNGGMITQAMHIVSGGHIDPDVCAPSRINYDYRMRNGLQILEALAPFFTK